MAAHWLSCCCRRHRHVRIFLHPQSVSQNCDLAIRIFYSVLFLLCFQAKKRGVIFWNFNIFYFIFPGCHNGSLCAVAAKPAPTVAFSLSLSPLSFSSFSSSAVTVRGQSGPHTFRYIVIVTESEVRVSLCTVCSVRSVAMF